MSALRRVCFAPELKFDPSLSGNRGPEFRIGAVLYATYFEVPAHRSASADITQEPGGAIIHGHMDPYRYRAPGSDLTQVAWGASLGVLTASVTEITRGHSR